MSQHKLARWLAVSSGLLTLAASAQTPAASAAPAAASAPAAITRGAASGEYRSALEGYQRYSEEKMVPWREANDTVGKIGGWRAYAKEAAQGPGHQGHVGHASPAASAPEPAASQAKP